MAKSVSTSGSFKGWFERIYKIGVFIKGFDGTVELVVGLILLISPRLVHQTLIAVSGEAGEHHAHVFQFISEYIARLDGTLGKGSLVFLIVFLIGNGIVKLVLVYCLLKEIVRAYPYALTILLLLFGYQVLALIQTPTIFLGVFTALDVIIIYLVWGEWHELRSKHMVPKTVEK